MGSSPISSFRPGVVIEFRLSRQRTTRRVTVVAWGSDPRLFTARPIHHRSAFPENCDGEGCI